MRKLGARPVLGQQRGSFTVFRKKALCLFHQIEIDIEPMQEELRVASQLPGQFQASANLYAQPRQPIGVVRPQSRRASPTFCRKNSGLMIREDDAKGK